MGCSSKCIKGSLFVFTFLYWLLSVCIILIGLWSFLEKTEVWNFSSADITFYQLVFDLSIFLCVIGVFMFFLTFAGCVGSLRENICLLNTFCLALLVLVLLQLVVFILCFIFSSEIHHSVSKLLQREGIPRYREDPDWNALVDWIQTQFSCCGFSLAGYRDWTNNIYFNCSDSNPSPERCAVPYSCCRDFSLPDVPLPNQMCGYSVQQLRKSEAASVIYTDGCIEILRGWATNRTHIFAIFAAVFLFLKLLGIFLARQLVNHIRTQRYLFKQLTARH